MTEATIPETDMTDDAASREPAAGRPELAGLPLFAAPPGPKPGRVRSRFTLPTSNQQPRPASPAVRPAAVTTPPTAAIDAVTDVPRWTTTHSAATAGGGSASGVD